MIENNKIAVAIPCYKVKAHIEKVIFSIGNEVDKIYIIDDKCPENTGKFVQESINDPRVKIIFNEVNLGVGGAVMAGYKQGLEDEIDIIVKIDGDGQMDASLIPQFVNPIIRGEADYTKGNRFYNPEDVKKMPIIRLIGNGLLSFITKISSGYWNIFDPTNGFTAIHMKALKSLPLSKIHNRYFFESDILFRLNTIKAVVIDIPMTAIYADEKSNMKMGNILASFVLNHTRNIFKRIFYNYFLRDMSIGSIELILGTFLTIAGVSFGICAWSESDITGITASSGTVMLAALPIIIGTQLLLSFLNYDIQSTPKTPINKLIK